MPCGAVMCRAVTVEFALNIVQCAVKFLLGMNLANAQMQRCFGQSDLAIPAKENRRAKHRRANFEAMHHTGRNEDCVMCGIAPRHTGNRDPPLTFGKPQQAGLRNRPHRFHTPATARGKARHGNKP